MILTSSEVQMYTKDTALDITLLTAMIPAVLEDAFDYMNNYFHNNNVRIRSNQLTFSTTGTIVITGTNFSTYSFQSGDEIHITNSARNDGLYTAATVSSATITVSTTQTLKTETSETETTIVKVDVPQSLKPVLSAMVKHKMDNPVGGYKSESLGDYSYTMGGSGAVCRTVAGVAELLRRAHGD